MVNVGGESVMKNSWEEVEGGEAEEGCAREAVDGGRSCDGECGVCD